MAKQTEVSETLHVTQRTWRSQLLGTVFDQEEKEEKQWDVDCFCNHKRENFEKEINDKGLIKAGPCLLVIGFCLPPDRTVT